MFYSNFCPELTFSLDHIFLGESRKVVYKFGFCPFAGLGLNVGLERTEKEKSGNFNNGSGNW